MSKFSTKKLIITGSIFVLVLIMSVFGVTFAIFNFTKTGQANTMSTSTVLFDFSDVAIDVANDFPQDGSISIEDLTVSEQTAHTGELTISGHNTLTNGVKYNIYLLHGDDITGKTRLNDENIKFQLVPNFTSGTNGFTVLSNDYANPTNLSFDNEGKALISTGLIKDTSQLTTVSYAFHMWIDGGGMNISSTTKRATLAEGNPSLADATTGNTTATRYMRNDATEASTVTLFPAKTNQVGKTIYTTYEFSNGYYNVKFLVEAENYKKTGSDYVKEAILAKEELGGSCSNITYEEDGIIYFTGTNACVDMNYVWYSGKLWRITAIYPDGAMKLVTQNNITSITFNAPGQVNFYTDSNTTSYIYQWLNEDFYDTLYNANGFIDTSKQWNATMPSDTNVSTKPLETNMVTANVGLLNNYEFYNSYRCIGSSTCTGSSYNTGYLNIGYYWWLLNLYNSSYVWRVDNGGYGFNAPTNTIGVRPSIYLKSGLEFTGDGSKQSPYKIVGDKDTGTANDLINTRLSGEYVKLSNGTTDQLFRIIGVEENKTKIIAMDYADNKSTKKFATSSSDTLWGNGTTTDTETWYTYLNDSSTGYLKNLKDTYGKLFDSGLYYLGTSGYNYKLSVCANTTSGKTSVCDKTSGKSTFNIGLPRYGEMFATQQSEGYSNSTAMWLINRYSTSNVWYVNSYGRGYGINPTNTYGARPTVHLKPGVKILSGSGTESDPYVVGL